MATTHYTTSPDAKGGRGTANSVTTILWATVRWLRDEVLLTWRLLRHNAIVCILPPILFALAAGVRSDLHVGELILGIGKAAALGMLYTYVGDSLNQGHGGAEDALNKPDRPIPAGLVSPKGLAFRFYLATLVYILLGWTFGVLLWVLIWQCALVIHYRGTSPRNYLWWKTPFNFVGFVVMLATGWQVVADIESVTWIWILTISLYFSFALIYEDVRDMDGDRVEGRRTTALVFGPVFVRRWFAAFMILLPGFIYFVLAHASEATDWRGVTSAAVLGILSWICAGRALFWRGRFADRVTHQLFCLTWALTVGSAPLLLAVT